MTNEPSHVTLDLLDFDAHESAAERAHKATVDLQLAKHVRDSMRAQGMRVPLTDEELFADADKRLKGGSHGTR